MRLLLPLVTLCFFMNCSGDDGSGDNPLPADAERGQANVWLTMGDQSPAWMKTNSNLKGGSLKTEAYDVYARYFVEFLDAYQEHGISIDAVTLQNEPLYAGAPYPCMKMSATEQLTFIKDHVGPLFEAEGIETKIIIYDHNWDNTDYPISILNDVDARKYVAGSAFHAYGGDVGAMSVVHNAHPDKGLYFTEIGGGEWSPGFSIDLQWNMNNIFIGTTKNWSKNALLWNLALDQDSGPNNSGDEITRGVVMIDNNSGVVTKKPEYYAIGHMSKFVRPGAFRIESSASTYISQFNFVAFLNPDGSKAIVMTNSGTEIKTVAVKQGERQFNYSVPAESAVTIVWN